ncbi:MAG: hypothetical protein HF314_03365 [Ignavibacteria bacterium]|jgi:hypothetical protein|nr:hypothetical protein [Ignavibacteria bacterium]MCU7502089.1 hypothetical protein [Ignavibacteria bacterium]MCU7515491.1 hypothetical protein [Ignavibacteria bacterium]
MVRSMRLFTALVLLLLIPAALFFISCAKEGKEDEGTHFYESAYLDEIVFKTPQKDVTIVIEQINLAPQIKEYIPYSLNPDAYTGDSTKLKLFVSYGNYYPEGPRVFQDVSTINDTVFIWYTNREKTLKRLSKTASINGPCNIPKTAYIRIDSVAVYSASNVKLITRIIR